MRALSLLLAAAMLSLTTGAQAARPTRLHVPVTRYVLPNGLTVILHPDHRLPSVVVDLWFHVGSKDERAGRSGFAHLFEHLMFMGTKNVPNGDFDHIMEAYGGQNNASTSEDVTNYYDYGPSNLLETFLWLEADRLSSLPAAMTAKKVDLQRDVVKNERRQRIENVPYGKVELVLPDKLFPPDHPYHHPVIGSHADLDAARVDDVKAFFAEFYVPSNASLVVSGDFEPAAARRLVDKYFGAMPKRPVPPHAAPKPVRLTAPVRVTMKDAVELPRVVLAWHSPAGFSNGDAECDLLAALLGGYNLKSSRLYQSLVHDRKLAQSIEVEQRSMRYGSELVITATAQSGHTSAELEQAIDGELGRLLGAAPPTAGELERARAYIETVNLRQLEQPVRLADALNQYEFRFGDPSQLEKQYLGRYDRVTLPSLTAVAKQVLHAPRVTIDVEPQGRP
jgi:predicted Zn-dependent peptidase